MPALNNAQFEILKLFNCDLSNEEIRELKQILSEYLAKKLVTEVDKEAKEKRYSSEILSFWKDEHFKTPYNK